MGSQSSHASVIFDESGMNAHFRSGQQRPQHSQQGAAHRSSTTGEQFSFTLNSQIHQHINHNYHEHTHTHIHKHICVGSARRCQLPHRRQRSQTKQEPSVQQEVKDMSPLNDHHLSECVASPDRQWSTISPNMTLFPSILVYHSGLLQGFHSLLYVCIPHSHLECILHAVWEVLMEESDIWLFKAIVEVSSVPLTSHALTDLCWSEDSSSSSDDEDYHHAYNFFTHPPVPATSTLGRILPPHSSSVPTHSRISASQQLLRQQAFSPATLAGIDILARNNSCVVPSSQTLQTSQSALTILQLLGQSSLHTMLDQVETAFQSSKSAPLSLYLNQPRHSQSSPGCVLTSGLYNLASSEADLNERGDIMSCGDQSPLSRSPVRVDVHIQNRISTLMGASQQPEMESKPNPQSYTTSMANAHSHGDPLSATLQYTVRQLCSHRSSAPSSLQHISKRSSGTLQLPINLPTLLMPLPPFPFSLPLDLCLTAAATAAADPLFPHGLTPRFPLAAYDLEFSWKDYSDAVTDPEFGPLTHAFLAAAKTAFSRPDQLGGVSRTLSDKTLIDCLMAPLPLCQSTLDTYLGGGFFGEVRLAQIKGFKKPVAVKTMMLTDRAKVESICKEAVAMAEVSKKRPGTSLTFHNLVFTSGPDRSWVYGHLVMSVAEGGTLEDFVLQLRDEGETAFYNRRGPEDLVVEVALWRLRNRTNQGVSLSSALICCVQDCIAMLPLRLQHNDIKPGNVLVTTSSRICPGPFPVTATLADYGLASYLPPGEHDAPAPGSTLYTTAPESLPTAECTGQVSPASDLYSLGLLIKEVLRYCEEALVRYGPELPELLRSSLSLDPSQRPTLSKLLMALMLWRAKMHFALSPNGELGIVDETAYTQLSVPRAPQLVMGALRKFFTARDSISLSIRRSDDEAATLIRLPYMHLWLAFDAVGHAAELGPHIEGVCVYKSGRGDGSPRFEAMRIKVAAVSQVMEGVKVLLSLEGKRPLGVQSAMLSAADRAGAQRVFEKAMQWVLRASLRV